VEHDIKTFGTVADAPPNNVVVPDPVWYGTDPAVPPAIFVAVVALVAVVAFPEMSAVIVPPFIIGVVIVGEEKDPPVIVGVAIVGEEKDPPVIVGEEKEPPVNVGVAIVGAFIVPPLMTGNVRVLLESVCIPERVTGYA
jgi:hypothetical protein